MTAPPPNSDNYWDTNLDPTNLGADITNAAQALRREIQFARLTPDIQQMLDHVAPPSAAAHAPPPKILDVGTGLGTAAALLRQRGATVIALDVSHQRLATMCEATRQLSQPHPFRRIYPIKARAEALPFRTGSLDAACSRAVLIHTDIPRAADEIARVLRPDAPVAFSEVLVHNPFVKLYRRTLAPREWQSITTYFGQQEIDTVSAPFTNPGSRRYYQLAFLAFAFQYALPSPAMFRLSLKLLIALDSLIIRLWPVYRRYAWFALITGRNPHP